MKPLPPGNYKIKVLYRSYVTGGTEKGTLLAVRTNGSPFIKLDSGCDGETIWEHLTLLQPVLVKNKLGNFPRKDEVEL